MGRPKSPNTQAILDLITENPGERTLDDVYGLFEPTELTSVKRAVKRMLEETFLIHKKGAYLYPGPSKEKKSTGDIIVQAREDHQSTISIPSPVSSMFSFSNLSFAHHEVDITLPPAAMENDFALEFRVLLRVEHAKRVGISPDKNIEHVFWMPVGAEVLRADLGDYPVPSGAEGVGNYLVVVVPHPEVKGKFRARFYLAPKGERFAVYWHDEPEEPDEE